MEIVRKFRKEIKQKVHVVFMSFDSEGLYHLYCKGILNQDYKYTTKWFKSIEETSEMLELEVLNLLKVGYVEDENIQYFGPQLSMVFDKAKWHFGGEFPDNLPQYQGYVITGFFVGYLIQNGMMSAKYYRHKNYLQHTEAVKNGVLSPVRFFHDYMDGVFDSADTNYIGYLFSKSHYEPDRYFDDLATIKAFEPLESFYHIEDNAENYQLVYAVIDRAFKAFLKDQQIVFP